MYGTRGAELSTVMTGIDYKLRTIPEHGGSESESGSGGERHQRLINGLIVDGHLKLQ